MKVLADTCIWSHVLRHKNPDPELSARLKDLIDDGRIVMIGPVRQELLSGISNMKHFDTLKELLAPFEDIPLRTEHFVKAAEFSNICRNKGIQGSTTDLLICAVASLEKCSIFTSDNDFENYRKFLLITLHE